MKKILFGVLVLAATAVQAQKLAEDTQASRENAGNFMMTPAMQKLQIVQMAIRALYVDKVDENKLAEDAIREMLAELDPHSSYSNPKEVKKLNEPLEGGFEGIGVEFQMMEDTLLVIQPMTDGPSERVGILAGDRIVQANGIPIAGQKISTDSIVSLLRGPKDSQVELGIARRGVAEVLPFTVTRDRIPIYSINASYMADHGIGYVHINRFASTTHEEFMKACAALQKEGMKDLIIDLQGNGGGLLPAAIQMANEFLKEKEVIVYTQGRVYPRNDYFAEGNGTLQKGRVVVLVDDFSASASEILAGAIQDWDRGLIVGRRTFGKGLVQNAIPLPDKSMIRLTTARYYTPAGRCIQKPYEKGSKKEYDDELDERFKHGEMVNADSIHFVDSLRYQTLKLHRTVYGGGGVMPDCFVPLDTTQYTPYYRNIFAHGLLRKYISTYLDSYRAELKVQYSDIESFQKKFEMSDEAIEGLKQTVIDWAKKAHELAPTDKRAIWDEEQFQQSLPVIRMQFKALVAREMWGILGYLRIANEQSKVYQKALSVLKDGTYEKMLKKKK